MENYEEKYNSLIAKLRAARNDEAIQDDRFCVVIDDIVPELAESDDEKIRKAILIFINQHYPVDSTVMGKSKILNWLEKKIEQKPVEMIQWKGDNLKEVIAFVGKCDRFGEWFKTWGEYVKYVHEHNNIVKLFNKDGSHYEVPVGAWIVKTPDGYNVPSQSRFVLKPAEWSEEDDYNHAFIVELLLGMNDCDKDYHEKCRQMAIWLKSLKDRYLPIQRQEWNEKDDEMINHCIGAIHAADYYDLDDKNEMAKFLKSLKPQSRWKPSDDDIKELKWCAVLVEDKVGTNPKRLQSIIDNLEKLM